MSWRLRPRFSIGVLLIVVALAAILTGVEVDRRRSVLYQDRAEWHASRVRFATEMAATSRLGVESVPELIKAYQRQARLSTRLSDGKQAQHQAQADLFARHLAAELANAAEWDAFGRYHAAMQQKYEQAGRAVWKSVEPDPPAPAEPLDPPPVVLTTEVPPNVPGQKSAGEVLHHP